MDIMELKRFLLLLTAIIASSILITPVVLCGCTHDIDRGTVFPAVEKTLSLPGEYNPVKYDLINRGLVKLDGTQVYINVGQIEKLVKDNVYKIDENGYLQFGASHTSAPIVSTPSPSYTPSDTSPVTPTPSYTLPPLITHPIIKPTTTPTPNYTPSGAIQERLHEEAQVFGIDIPIPTYLPEGYVITDAQFIQKQYSYDHLELTITAPGEPDIITQITWYHGPFRILPSSENYTLFDISGGPGTYSKWAMLNHHSDHNDLQWDWVPETFPPNSTSPIAYYEIILSASTGVPVEELVNIARFVRIP